jgi:hypothetical protein
VIPEECKGLSSGMKRSLLSKGDHPIYPTPEFFSLGKSGSDPFMLKQGHQHISEHQLSMLGMAT